MKDSDDELMLRIGRGDRMAFRELFHRYGGALLGYARHFLGSLPRAEEITQEVWVKVVQLAPQYEGRGQFSAWARTMTRHLCLNVLRDERRLVYAPTAEDEVSETSTEKTLRDSTATIEDELIMRANLAEAKKILDLLPENQRVALLLHVVEEMSYEEIAQELSLSLSAVKSLIFRARRELGVAS